MKAALEAVQRGELVSDDLVIAMVRERSDWLQDRGGFLLDGFPRTLTQAEALETILNERDITLDGVLSFELPLEEIVGRLSGRRTCMDCGAVFHVSSNPPERPDVCDHCAGYLTQRDDDRPEAIRVRMRVYEDATRPLIDFYRRMGKLIPISAHGSPMQVRDRTLELLNQRAASPQALAAR